MDKRKPEKQELPKSHTTSIIERRRKTGDEMRGKKKKGKRLRQCGISEQAREACTMHVHALALRKEQI